MAARFLAFALLVTLFSGAGLAQPADPLRVIAARSVELSTQIADAEAALDHRLEELADLRREKRDLDERMRWVERRAAVPASGEEFNRTRTQFLQRLPAA